MNYQDDEKLTKLFSQIQEEGMLDRLTAPVQRMATGVKNLSKPTKEIESPELVQVTTYIQNKLKEIFNDVKESFLPKLTKSPSWRQEYWGNMLMNFDTDDFYAELSNILSPNTKAYNPDAAQVETDAKKDAKKDAAKAKKDAAKAKKDAAKDPTPDESPKEGVKIDENSPEGRKAVAAKKAYEDAVSNNFPDEAIDKAHKAWEVAYAEAQKATQNPDSGFDF